MNVIPLHCNILERLSVLKIPNMIGSACGSEMLCFVHFPKMPVQAFKIALRLKRFVAVLNLQISVHATIIYTDPSLLSA